MSKLIRMDQAALSPTKMIMLVLVLMIFGNQAANGTEDWEYRFGFQDGNRPQGFNEPVQPAYFPMPEAKHYSLLQTIARIGAFSPTLILAPEVNSENTNPPPSFNDVAATAVRVAAQCEQKRVNHQPVDLANTSLMVSLNPSIAAALAGPGGLVGKALIPYRRLIPSEQHYPLSAHTSTGPIETIIMTEYTPSLPFFNHRVPTALFYVDGGLFIHSTMDLVTAIFFDNQPISGAQTIIRDHIRRRAEQRRYLVRYVTPPHSEHYFAPFIPALEAYANGSTSFPIEDCRNPIPNPTPDQKNEFYRAPPAQSNSPSPAA